MQAQSIERLSMLHDGPHTVYIMEFADIHAHMQADFCVHLKQQGYKVNAETERVH